MGSQRAILLLLIAIQVYYESVLAKSVHHPDDAYSDNEKAHLTKSQSSVPSENLKARQTLSDHSVGKKAQCTIYKKNLEPKLSINAYLLTIHFTGIYVSAQFFDHSQCTII